MWTILHWWQISISAGAKYCLSHRANLTFCWFLDEQFRHGLECFSLVLLRNLSQYPSTFLQNKKNSTSGSTWRVKAVIIEATSPPWAVSNAAWPAGFSGWQFETTGKTFNFKASLLLLLLSFYSLSFQDPKFLTLEMMVRMIMQGFHTAGVLWICIQWAN